MKNRLRVAAFFCLQLAVVAQPVHPQMLRGHVPATVADLKPVGRLEAGRDLRLAIGLPLRNREGLTNLLQRIYDPASPDYRHYLSPAQFAKAFGPTEADYRAVAAFAEANGLHVAGTYSNQALLDVIGSVSNIEKTLHVKMRTYQHPRENRLFYAPDAEPSLDLSIPVLHISGLDDYVKPQPMNLIRNAQPAAAKLALATGSGPAGAYMGDDFRAAYVPGLALDGSGQSVGLVEFDGYYPGDITNYAAIAAVPGVPLTNVYLDAMSGTPGQNNVEVALDIDMAICMAPGLSSVIVYEGELADDILNRMATDALANQFSSSWNYVIDSETEQIFQQFAAQGESFFNASGDRDAWVGAIPTPSDDPNITIVGGTTLTTSGPGGAWVSETVWNWDVEFGPALNGQGTGGGISGTYAIPAWQLGVNMAGNQGSSVFRNAPDVALTADNVFVIANNGQQNDVGGTSCAAPLWAGFVALANQKAATQDGPTLGFINPAIYALGLSANYTNCFHDITTGNNTWTQSPTRFYAVPGYDLCTGWGTPAGSNLISVLALDSLQISPTRPWTPGGAVGGPPTPASQIYELTNVGSASFDWAVGVSTPWLTVSSNAGSLAPGEVAATVVASFNANADALLPGLYSGAILFTNLSDGVVQTRDVFLAVIKPPEIIAQPANLALIGGTTATFAAVAAGGLPLNWQWQHNGANLQDNGRVSGSQSALSDSGNIYGSAAASLTIRNIAASDGGTYTLVATNVAGVAVSLPAALTVVPSGPVIILQPFNQTALVGATVHFVIVANGTAPFTYQWQQNGTNLADGGGVSGALTPTLTLNGASSASIGTYSVTVGNTIGTTISDGATLAVQVANTGGQVVQNGGFETGDFSSWNETGSFAQSSVTTNSTGTHSGNYGALLASPGALGFLSQVLPTIPGQTYMLSFWLDSPDGAAPNEFQVAWNGTVVFDQINLGAIGWTNIQFTITAADTNAVLEFGFRDDSSFFGLDDIQVVPFASADGPPIIATQPLNQASIQGGTAAFNVLSSGQFPLFYQWQFDGADIDNATNATLQLANLAATQAGAYSVVVSNSLGSTTSSAAFLTVLNGQEELITFDDLPYRLVPIPAGYNNLTWSNFDYLNSAVNRGSGYGAAMVSIPKVAYNAGGTPAAISAASPFALFSAYMTAAWNDNLRVEAQGFNGSALVYDNTYTLSATAPTLITFNYVDVTSVRFISSGGNPHGGYSGSGTQFAMDNVNAYVVPIPPALQPESMALLYSFGGFDGGHPSSALAPAADGSFYGTTLYGGMYGDGTVFSITTNGALTTLYSFDGVDGANPDGPLAQGADGNFYGTTEFGGTNDYGTVFSVTTNGTLTTLASFDLNVTGGNPDSTLTLGSDGNFYGVTPVGGMYGFGTIFDLATNGALTTLVSFDSTNGDAPYGAMALGVDGNLYGTTLLGGKYSTGTVFSISTNGTLTTVLSLTGLNAYPSGGLVLGADGKFYGTSQDGGTTDYGTVFSVTTNGTLSTLVSFNYYVSGAYPLSTLVQGLDGTLYGTTSAGGSYGTTYFNGTYGGGTVFGITTNGVFTTLLAYQDTNGLSPQVGLVLGADGNFYGTTAFGGLGFNGYYNSGDGVVFRIGASPAASLPAVIAQPVSQSVPVSASPNFTVNAGGAAPLRYSWQRNGSPIAGATQSRYTTDRVLLTDSGNRYSCVISNAYGTVVSSDAELTVVAATGTLVEFNGANGGYPCGALTQDANGNFYGTTEYGGAYGNGTVFKVAGNGALSTVASLNFYVTGANPLAGLIKGSDGNFYGTAAYGGIHGGGTVFRVTVDGTLAAVYAFSGSDGSEPSGALELASDGKFYGTTFAGGTYGYGTVFSLTASGALTTLFAFDFSDGAYPQGALLQGADGNFYGTTADGGTNSDGTVFRMTTNGTMTTLVSFGGIGGADPHGTLVTGVDGNFYGTTTQGGVSNYGTVFSMASNGVVTALLQFDGTNGAYPQGSLVLGADGNFYGTTAQGGKYGEGTIFSVTTNGSVTSLFSFSGTNGSYPSAGIVQGSDGNFYGTTTYGGLGFDGLYWSGNGAVFRLAGVLPAEAPSIITQPATQIILVGNSVAFTVAAAGSTPLTYLWQRNGTDIAGATQSTYVTNGVQLSDSGSVFSCLVGNAYGSTRTADASLTVVTGKPGLITFDELRGPGAAVPGGYFNLAWNNFDYINGASYGQPSGFSAGVVSTNNSAYNNTGAPADISASVPFNFLSAYLTAAWYDGLLIEAQGYNGSALNYDNFFILSATAPTQIPFNYLGVTSVKFIASGGSPHPGYEGSGGEFVIDNVILVQVPVSANPGPVPKPLPYSVMYNFGGNEGGQPASGMALGADGNLYGTTEYGGANQSGAVFKLTAGGGVSTMASFAGTNGAIPQSALMQGVDGNLYGTASQGGAHGQGAVFSVATNGALNTLCSFGGIDGANPGGGLLQGADGNFYGTTTQGGSFGDGTVYSVTANGVLATLHSFSGLDGANPYGTLAQGADGSFYGTTQSGGTNDAGTVFSIATNGTISTLASFNYDVTGAYPTAGLLEGSDGNLYGTTEYGGTNGDGTIFRMTTGGTLSTLYSFDNVNGAEPYGALIQGADGFIYGTTEYGGTNDGGTVFGMTTNGTVVSLFSFQGSNGFYPQGGLAQGVDGNFYGTATYGGEGFNGYYNSGDGVVFRLGSTPVASPPVIIAQPANQIVTVSGAAYFSVRAGGTGPLSYSWRRNGSPIAGATQTSYSAGNAQLTDSGARFDCVISNAYGSVTTSEAALTIFAGSGSIFDFDGAGGGYPAGGVVQGSDGNFYGTTQYGGTYGSGTVFSLTTNGLLSTLVSFDGSNGAEPGAALAQGTDGNFYGTTQAGGMYQNGTIFRMKASGELTTLVSFDGANGAEPDGALVEGSDGNFYGTTEDGGTNGYGTVFSMTTDGTLTVLHTFNYADGAYPQSALTQGFDGNFYGTTEDGGTNGYGTVFNITTNGTLNTLMSFGDTNGAYPQGGLAQTADGNFYGTTTEGGTYGQGTVFRMAANGTLTSLLSFNGASGNYPEGALIQASDGNLYGATAQGGLYGDGTIFGLSTNGAKLLLFSFEGINGAHPSAGVMQASDSSLYVTASYGGLGEDGFYSSGNGVVLRLSGSVPTAPPLIITQPANQTAHVGGTAVFTVAASSSTPLSYMWQRNGANIPGATLSTYTTNDVQLPDSGNSFTCVISNSYQFIVSSNAILTVIPGIPPPPPNAPVPLPYSVMYNFGGNEGGQPASGMALGADGNLYGTTEYGGANQSGAVFKLTAGGGVSTMASFAGTNGAIPQSALMQGVDGNLYGTASQGGAHGQGAVFSVATNGALNTLCSFGGIDGANPGGGLLQGADGNFYGTTTQGGSFGDGTVYSVTANGVLATLHSFSGLDGANPYGTLAQGADGSFYGTTQSGGTNDAGTVFSIATNGTISTLASFNYDVTGAYPTAGLLEGSDGNLYGTTEYGGTNGDGTIFRMTTGGTLSTLYSFDNVNGAEPYGALIQGADGFIYGTTEYGGTNDGGTVFGMTTNGTVVSLFSFQGSNGFYPQGGLAQGVDGNFYGTATYGGEGFNGYYNSGDGVVFRLGSTPVASPPVIIAQPANQIVTVSGAAYFSVRAGGTGPLSYSWRRNGSPIAGATQTSYSAGNAQLTDSGARFDCVISNAYGSVTTSEAALTIFAGSGSIFDFDGAGGGYPAGGVVQGSDGNFYGTTQYGGTYGSGTVFSLTTNGLLSTLVSFDGSNGAEPGAALAQGTDGNFYGTTQAGGMYQNGTIFRMKASGELTTLVSFDGANGAEPDGALVEGSDGNFYGTTEDGGTNGYGTVFSMTTDGTLTVLHTFNYADGAYPQSALTQGFDGNFYGTTEDGGTNGYGTVFNITTNGTLNTLMSFGDTNGAYPQGGLAQTADGNFYGTTTEGGTYGQGTVFRMAANGTLTSLLSFNGASGNYPEGALIQASDGNLYGATAQGGLYGDGTIFGLSTNGAKLLLFSFEGINGAHPSAGVMQASDSSLYVTASYGGLGEDGFYSSGNGVVLRLSGSVPTAPPLIITQPANQTAHVGGTAVFTVAASSSTPLSYMWQRNGANIPGATLSTYTTNDVQLPDSGNSFTCVISNSYGVTPTADAILTIGPPSLLQNGGFELGTFADWITSGNFADCSVVSAAPFVHSGVYGAKLGPVVSAGYISQTLATTVGELYQISFWLNSDGLTPNEFSVSWNGATLFDRQNIATTSWASFQLNAVASVTNTALTFGFRDDPSYFGLDDIAVYPIGLAPPEIQTVALMNGAVNLTWGATVGQSYQVQTTTDLSQNNWTTLGESITATNSTVTVSEPAGASLAQFYRLVLAP